MEKNETREPQYQRCVDLLETQGLSTLGLGTNQLWKDDPRHLIFVLSRYKFVSKMLSGMNHVLEVGCGDGFGSRIVQQEVSDLTAIDFDPVFVSDAKKRMDSDWKFDVKVHDILEGPVIGSFDAAFSLDVIEHIPKKHEKKALRNIVDSLTENGVLVIGTPSIQSQVYASEPSKIGHVNCKDHKALKILLSEFFNNVFIFSMNDETIHTGFYPMAHYLMALCCKKKLASE